MLELGCSMSKWYRIIKLQVVYLTLTSLKFTVQVSIPLFCWNTVHRPLQTLIIPLMLSVSLMVYHSPTIHMFCLWDDIGAFGAHTTL